MDKELGNVELLKSKDLQINKEGIFDSAKSASVGTDLRAPKHERTYILIPWATS